MQGSSSPMDNSTSFHQYCKRCSTCHSTCGGTPNRIGLFIETHLDETVDPTQGTYMSAPILRDPCLASGSPVSPGMRFAILMGRSQDLSPSTSAHGDWTFTPPSTGDTTTTITDLASLPASLSGVLETGLPILTPYSTIQIPSIPDDRIVSSPFFLQHTKEPRIESPEGQYLCATNTLGLCFSEPDEGRPRRGRSIYLVFVDMENRRCLICEKTGRSRSYLLECDLSSNEGSFLFTTITGQSPLPASVSSWGCSNPSSGSYFLDNPSLLFRPVSRKYGRNARQRSSIPPGNA
ncbi:hypothetical protein FRC16_009504 [Serendipita sp. 398]|nr:hypothetical protein FRC16_009504 [Serendipita sp. 398]